MNPYILCYDPEPSRDQVDPTIGLSDLHRGLQTIVVGYLLSLAAFLGTAGVLWYVTNEIANASSSWKAIEKVSTLLFATALLLALIELGSLSLIVRGKWTCLMNAPEHFQAKWLMFLSISCILAAPALHVGSFFMGEAKEDPKASASTKTSAALLREFEDYKRGMRTLDSRGYVKLVGNLAALLSSVFFVLFLRAVALCWGAQQRVRLAELYLVFVTLLAVGLVVFLWNPSYMLAKPRLLLGLGSGWLIAGLWYLGLILNTSAGIRDILAR
jgi:hypothetical protein